MQTPRMSQPSRPLAQVVARPRQDMMLRAMHAANPATLQQRFNPNQLQRGFNALPSRRPMAAPTTPTPPPMAQPQGPMSADPQADLMNRMVQQNGPVSIALPGNNPSNYDVTGSGMGQPSLPNQYAPLAGALARPQDPQAALMARIRPQMIGANTDTGGNF